jgi:hypothetical protein
MCLKGELLMSFIKFLQTKITINLNTDYGHCIKMTFRNYDVIKGVRKVESSLVMEGIDLGGV